MRRHGSTILALALLAAPALAQPPGDGNKIIPTPGAGNGAGARLGNPGQLVALDPKNRLDQLLMQWEAAMKDVPSIVVKDCMRTDKDPTSQKPKVWKGEARYMKPNLAALLLKQVDDPKFYELMVCTGQFLYEYRPQFKKLMIHDLPERATGFDNNLLSFLFGMSAVDAKRRYDLKISKDVTAENPNWIYLDITPRFDADKREFSQAQLVLFANTMLPRRLWFLHPNGSEVTWDLPNMDTTTKLSLSDFRPPDAPKDWEKVRVPMEQPAAGPGAGNGAPRVVRPSGNR
jgi:TIGR03009 family protein